MSAVPQWCAYSIAQMRYELATRRLLALPLKGRWREIVTMRAGARREGVLDEVRGLRAGLPAR